MSEKVDFEKGSKSNNWKQKKFQNQNRHGDKKEKFVANFKKKTPTWKQIDSELKELLPKYDEIDASKITSFDDFPISKRTLDGLKSANYHKPTEIQRESIGIALKGYDLLGAAQTGSGKTLAFLIPILECLHRLKWSKFDGLGVLVISPTRELAYQTFEVLKKIGKFHDFSAGLVIGGKDLKTESKLISQTNIIICTPGRLLQHMDETWNFSCDNLKILVLDEADRILDMGFAETMNAIVNNLPKSRQTMLFSATQTKSIKDLARLSLKNPTYVSVHEHAAESTPKNLVQTYVVCELHEKLSFLWSFIRNHLNQKIIVFLQSCKQVKFVHEAFTRMQTGMTTLCLYGTMNQLRRMEVYDEFCRKSHVILFSTDLAARGLDFPSVNWVLQVDCPPDANTYIHRVGRTARYEKDGQALLILTPQEQEEMLNQLKASKIPINEIKVNMKRLVNIDSKLQSICAGDVELKESAKRALMAYVRSVFLMSNKKIFNVESIDVAKFSSSLGLVVAPRLRFLKRQMQAKESKQSKQVEADEEESQSSKKTKVTPFQKKLALLKKQENAAEKPANFDFDDENQDGDFFKVKRVELESDEDSDASDTDLNLNAKSKGSKIKTKASIVKKLKKKNIKINEKVLFDEEGNRIVTGINVPKSINITEELVKELNEKNTQGPSGIDIEEAKTRLKNEDQFDKQLYRERIKKMHRERRLKEKDLRRAKRLKTEEGETNVGAVLKTENDDEENSDVESDEN